MADKSAPQNESQPKASPPQSVAATPASSSSAASTTPVASTSVAAANNSSSSSSSAEHQLETAWTFYFDRKLSREAQAAAGFTNYAQNLQKVGIFNTIEGFWRHYAFMQQPDQIPRDHNLYLFRDSLLPAWETFPSGGSWIIKVRKGNGVISRLWEELCFACVAEWFEDPDVVGVTLATRVKDDNLSVWTKTGMNMRIGEKLKDLLNLDESTVVEFKPFAAAIQDNSSFRNARGFTYAPTM